MTSPLDARRDEAAEKIAKDWSEDRVGGGIKAVAALGFTAGYDFAMAKAEERIKELESDLKQCREVGIVQQRAVNDRQWKEKQELIAVIKEYRSTALKMEIAKFAIAEEKLNKLIGGFNEP